MLKVTEHKTVS